MDRANKIKMLKELQAGIITIEAFKSKHFRIEVDTISNSGAYFVNDKEVDSETYGNEIEKETICENEISIFIDGIDLEERQ